MRTDETEFLPVQRRSRFILSQPTLWGQRCPDLHETRPCMDLMRCRSYHWQATDWSRCMFHRYQDECGTGYRARGIVLVLLLAVSFPLPHLAVIKPFDAHCCHMGSVGVAGGWGFNPQTLIFERKSALNLNPWAKFQTFRHPTPQLF